MVFEWKKLIKLKWHGTIKLKNCSNPNNAVKNSALIYFWSQSLSIIFVAFLLIMAMLTFIINIERYLPPQPQYGQYTNKYFGWNIRVEKNGGWIVALSRPPVAMATHARCSRESVLRRWIILLFVNTFSHSLSVLDSPPPRRRLRNQFPASQLTRRGWCSASGASRVLEVAGRFGSRQAGRRLEGAWCSGSLWQGWVVGSGWGGTPAGRDAGLCPRPGIRKFLKYIK